MRLKHLTLAALMLALIPSGWVYALAENSYESKHGFKIDYPDGWHLESFMDIYKTLMEAERVGGNFFQITSYPADDARSESRYLFSRDTLRIDAWVYPRYNGTLGQMITQTKDVAKLENFTIDGKKAKKVWRNTDDGSSLGGDQVLSIYFVDEGKKVIFVCYPSFSSLMDKCDEIVGSFRFE